jgi:hypothetical protein
MTAPGFETDHTRTSRDNDPPALHLDLTADIDQTRRQFWLFQGKSAVPSVEFSDHVDGIRQHL